MTDLYVSATGSDSNDGSQAKPLKTIPAADARAKPGTVVHVGAGTYSGGFTTQSSGTASARIRFEAAPGAKIVGSGNGADTAWWSKGSYVDVVGFELDGSGPGAISWQTGLYGTGSHCSFVRNVVHDILVDPTTFDTYNRNGQGGAALMMDGYSGGTAGALDGNTVFNVGPPGSASQTIQGIYFTMPGTVQNNIVHHVCGDGIETWHGAQNITIANNTIDHASAGILVGSGDSGLSATSGDHFTVRNNIIANCSTGIVEQGQTGKNNRYTRNLVFNCPSGGVKLQTGTATGTLQADPKFVNAAQADYTLQAGSPAIGAGLDGTGKTVDIGAKQSAAASQPAGTGPTAAGIAAARTALLAAQTAVKEALTHVSDGLAALGG